MAEIIGIIWLTRIVSRMAVGKGYSKWYAALVPAVWFATELVVAIALVIFVPNTNQYALMFLALAGGVSGGAAVYFFTKNLAPRGGDASATQAVRPLPGSVTAPAPTPAGGQALAGYCHECGTNVWLTPDGECENGHGRDSVSGVYWALR